MVLVRVEVLDRPLDLRCRSRAPAPTAPSSGSIELLLQLGERLPLVCVGCAPAARTDRWPARSRPSDRGVRLERARSRPDTSGRCTRTRPEPMKASVQRACGHRIPYKGAHATSLAYVCAAMCACVLLCVGDGARRRVLEVSGATARPSSTATRSSSRATAQLARRHRGADLRDRGLLRLGAGEGRSRQAPGERTSYPVMKLNLVRDFQTGIYDYNMMTSTFLRTESAAATSGRSAKISFSSQEWCGHVYMQWLPRGGKLVGDVAQLLRRRGRRGARAATLPAGRRRRGALPMLVRGLRGDWLAPGEIEEGAVPALAAAHAPPARAGALGRGDGEPRGRRRARSRPRSARCARSPTPSAETGGDTITCTVEEAAPHRLLAWKSSSGESARILGSARLALLEDARQRRREGAQAARPRCRRRCRRRSSGLRHRARRASRASSVTLLSARLHLLLQRVALPPEVFHVLRVGLFAERAGAGDDLRHALLHLGELRDDLAVRLALELAELTHEARDVRGLLAERGEAARAAPGSARRAPAPGRAS